MFAIVDFYDGMHVVPIVWLSKNNSACLWPNEVTSQLLINKMVMACHEPDTSWVEYPVTKCYGFDDTYVNAVAKLKLYRQISDIDSGPDSAKAQRKNLKRKIISDESDSDLDLEDMSESIISSRYPNIPQEMSEVAPRKKKSTKGHKSKKPSDKMAISNPENEQNCSSYVSPTCSLSFTSLDNGHHPILPINVNPPCNQCELKDKKITDTLALILKKVNHVIHKINALETKVNSGDSCGTDEIVADIMGKFPLNEMNQLEELELFLNEEKNHKDLVRALRGIGGENAYFIVTKILKRTFSNRLAEMFSWAGAKKKQAFKNLKFSKSLLETARLSLPSITEVEISTLVANWLRHAKQRRERAEGVGKENQLMKVTV